MIFKKKQQTNKKDVAIGIGLIVFSGIGLVATAVQGSKGAKKSAEFMKEKLTQLNEKGQEVIIDIKQRLAERKAANSEEQIENTNE